MKKKILVTNLQYAFGGAEKSIVDVCKVLRNNYEILFLVENPLMQKLLRENNINYNVIKTGQIKKNYFLAIVYFFMALIKIFFIVSKYKPNIIISNTNRSHVISSILSFITNTPLLWILRNYNFNKNLQKFFCKFADGIICVSLDLKNYYSNKNNSRYMVINNGFKLDNKQSNYSLKYRFNYDLKNSFIIGVASNFARWKGIEYLIEAFKKLNDNKKKEPVALLIAGSTKLGTDANKYYNELNDLVLNLGLCNKVIFTGWIDNINEFFYNCDVIVSCSVSDYSGPESFGRTIIEAWCNKKPVIVTNVGGPKYIVDNNINGIKVLEKDVNDLYKALAKIYKNKKLRFKLARNGYNKYLKEFTLNSVVKKYDKILKSCIKN
ncbi:MAG: glycosyltransferase family 4 protein [archaeon]